MSRSQRNTALDFVAAQISAPLADKPGMAAAMRQTPFDGSGLFNRLVRQQLQSGDAVSSKASGPDSENHTNADPLLPQFASDRVLTAPYEQKLTGMASLGSPAKPISLDSTAIQQAPPDTMPPGKSGGTPDPALMVTTVRPAPACGSMRSEGHTEFAESSTKMDPGPSAMADGHYATRSARARSGASTGVPSAMDADDLGDKRDGTKIDDRSGVTGAGISDTSSTNASFRRVTTCGDSAIDAPVLDSEVSAAANAGRTAPQQIHGFSSVDEDLASNRALSAVKAEENSSAPKVVSSSTAVSPKENVAKAIPHAASHQKDATESLQPAIVAEPYTGTSALAQSGPVAATFPSADVVQSKTVTLPASKVILATSKGQAARVGLPIGQIESAHRAGRSVDAALDGQQTAGKSVGFDDKPESSPRTASLTHSDTAAGRAVALDRVTVPQIPPPVSPSTSAKNSGPDLIASGALSQAQPIHPTSGTGTTQQASPDVHSLWTPASATFDRMDAAAVPKVIESAPQRLAVGVHNAGLGWVEIRTNSAAGQVSATLASGSAETHSAISAQLPTMRENLASEHVHIDTLASERFSPSSGSHHSSSEDQSRSGDGRQLGTVKSEIFLGASPVDVDTEMSSYINVRV
jgi:hypothetical protein